MFTAISSLSAHKSYMDVVSDNISNVNTTGFKASRAKFQSQMAEMINPGSAPTPEVGGMNPSQIGLGARMTAVTPNLNQGSLNATSRNTDMAVQGNGFFMYRNDTDVFYSRDGAVRIDADGYLVNEANGYFLQGWTAEDSGLGMTVDSSQPTGDIQLPLNTSQARATEDATIGGNLDSSTSVGDTYEVTFGVYDSLGDLQNITLTFERASDSEWDWTASGTGVSGNGTITFDTNGMFDSATANTVTVTGSGGAANTVFDIDFSNATMLSSANDISVTYQDGLAAGGFTSFKISNPTGMIYGLFTNGEQQLVGQVSLASFVNPAGLERINQNLFMQGLNSGDPSVGEANTGGRGSINSGYLEASNVDLAQEFTNMIIAQRGFQASSRVITTSDEMLQELVNIKR
jgi:flagellar hook protein FlgE